MTTQALNQKGKMNTLFREPRLPFLVFSLILGLQSPQFSPPSMAATTAILAPAPVRGMANTSAFDWTGLVAYYKMENTNDSGPFGHNLTPVNSPSFSETGIINNAAACYSSTNSYFTCSSTSDFQFSTNFSISFWAFKFSQNNGPKAVMSKYPGEYYFAVGTSANGTQAYGDVESTTGGEFGVGARASNAYPLTNTWYHTVWVYDGTQTGNSNRMTCYINGIKQTLTFDGSVPAEMSNTSNTFYIGQYVNGDGNVNGRIDEVAIFKNRTLTASDAISLYNSGAPNHQYPN